MRITKMLLKWINCLYLLEPRPRLEGSYKIGSVRLSRSFLRIGSLVFLET